VRVESTGRGREGNEEGVTLGVDLDAAVTDEGLAKDPSVFFQSLRVRVRTEVVQELRRTLDVGEQEGDSPGREIAAHMRMMRQTDDLVTRTGQPGECGWQSVPGTRSDLATDWQHTHQDDAGLVLNIPDETCYPTCGDRINRD
jgi:hypothetical protein